MSLLPTPPITPLEQLTFANSQHPNAPNRHNFSLTPLQLLPKRLRYRAAMCLRRPQRIVVVEQEEIVTAAPRLQEAMWGRNGEGKSEMAEAAAILEGVRTNGRVYDRRWGIETARLIPWRCAAADYSGPSLVYDVLINKVRRIQIQDQARFRDVEENLGVWGREMDVTRWGREKGDAIEEDEEEHVETEGDVGEDSDEESESEESVEDESEDEDSEEEDSDEDVSDADTMDESESVVDGQIGGTTLKLLATFIQNSQSPRPNHSESVHWRFGLNWWLGFGNWLAWVGEHYIMSGFWDGVFWDGVFFVTMGWCLGPASVLGINLKRCLWG
ncbi:hypothetical protein V492_05846 [Pseudogymnoascus sp. VKM F-4246]|nr:hypothetical protein V492_05846 [Pseudogymnoascus sp. VKM F-4246]